jgi:hypothetical protein
MLFNLNDINFANKQTFAGFNDYSFLDASYPKNNNLSDLTDNFLDSISSNLKEVNGWFGYFNPIKSNVGLCDFSIWNLVERFHSSQILNHFQVV